MVLKGEVEDYIHAVVVNVSIMPCFICDMYAIRAANLLHTLFQGYKQQRAFIIAQGPMQSTARDFWKMIHDRKCGVVVILSDLVEAGKVGRSALAVVACSDVSLCAFLPLQEVCYQYILAQQWHSQHWRVHH